MLGEDIVWTFGLTIGWTFVSRKVENMIFFVFSILFNYNNTYGMFKI